jgi:hypothetical protein
MDYTKTPNIAPEKIEKSEKLGNLDYTMEYVDPPNAKVSFANYYNEQILPFIKEEEAKIQAEESKILEEHNNSSNSFNIANSIAYLSRSRNPFFAFLLLCCIFGNSLAFTFSLRFAESAGQKLGYIVLILCPLLIYWLIRSLESNTDTTSQTEETPQIDYRYERTLERFKLHSTVSSKALKFLLPDLQELERSPITGKKLKSFCALNANWNLEEQKDTYNYRKGNYKDVSFELYQHMDNDGDELFYEYLFIILNMNTNFKGTTIIIDRKFNYAGWVGKDFKHLPKIKLEGEHFDNNKPDSQKFDVYSSDQEEITNLLNSSFMDAILKLDALFDNSLSLNQISYHKNQVVFIIEKYNDSGTKVSYKLPWADAHGFSLGQAPLELNLPYPDALYSSLSPSH